eukprot:12219266-Prorocentrum_lima.AAC.1
MSNSFLRAELGSSSRTAGDQLHLVGTTDEIMEKGEEEAKRKRGRSIEVPAAVTKIYGKCKKELQ